MAQKMTQENVFMKFIESDQHRKLILTIVLALDESAPRFKKSIENQISSGFLSEDHRPVLKIQGRAAEAGETLCMTSARYFTE